MKRILHLLLGLGFTMILATSGFSEPVKTNFRDRDQIVVAELCPMHITVAMDIEPGDLVPGVPTRSYLPGDLVAPSPVFVGLTSTHFARSATSYDFRRRWYHQANFVSSKYYIPQPLRTKPGPGRSNTLFKVWPQG